MISVMNTNCCFCIFNNVSLLCFVKCIHVDLCEFIIVHQHWFLSVFKTRKSFLSLVIILFLNSFVYKNTQALLCTFF